MTSPAVAHHLLRRIIAPLLLGVSGCMDLGLSVSSSHLPNTRTYVQSGRTQDLC